MSSLNQRTRPCALCFVFFDEVADENVRINGKHVETRETLQRRRDLNACRRPSSISLTVRAPPPALRRPKTSAGSVLPKAFLGRSRIPRGVLSTRNSVPGGQRRDCRIAFGNTI